MDEKTRIMLTELRSTMQTPGWTHLVNGWKEEQAQLPEIAFHGAKTMEDVAALRVRFELLSQLIGIEEDINSSFEADEQQTTDEY